ncbi:protein FAR1-RELATED SEQUENCE 5-like [Ipomoea triloba]|uniref:protein FAR1-RELATED SEQUENCE 5-like n=1 Tax=Ipomoea triloba TaxID=35885 RepID=UPI00125D72A2|nr:protein FAR1-RELATED SEQUENCE 5-like [Ipomoea triloba]
MGHAPNYIIIDQDPAIRVILGKVFPATRHRFCMWHIMTKLGEKAGPVLAKDDVFRRKLNAIVWNEMINIDEFEEKWKGLMEDYELVESTWFQEMFELRSFWIPAYFRDMDMGGLIRTTSRSKGENSIFGRFFSNHSTLVEFLMHFESALDAQRYEEAELNAACEGHFAKFKTPLLLERHAASEYTVSIFHEVQTEIEKSCFSCSVISIAKNGQIDSYEIKRDDDTVLCVTHNPNDETISCTCRMFTRVGLLCRHIFLIFKDCRIDRIPA